MVDDASSLVRPGCIAAFSETELGGGLEVACILLPTHTICINGAVACLEVRMRLEVFGNVWKHLEELGGIGKVFGSEWI